jgi:hypothetical protein
MFDATAEYSAPLGNRDQDGCARSFYTFVTPRMCLTAFSASRFWNSQFTSPVTDRHRSGRPDRDP